MSRRNLDKKYSPEDIIPYLYSLFYERMPKVSKPIRMYLVGSRGRLPLEEWGILKGKDWDIVVEFDHCMRDANSLIDSEYNIEIMCCDTKNVVDSVRSNNYKGSGKGIELFPDTPEEFKKFLA